MTAALAKSKNLSIIRLSQAEIAGQFSVGMSFVEKQVLACDCIVNALSSSGTCASVAA